ncbi:MAG TPA: MazG nucleotide pyrophosphohydrolase domain-containing protein [Chlamydiales bacterium]|nr:MazG nucleotide pyrophosphohydrolase domain-containing protein [Chlamydiales bacterium]
MPKLNAMEEFKNLVAIADRLLGPQGCPWDREQTFFTLQPYLLEETHELMEAIDLQNPQKISEELGDVLYALVFIAKLGEKAKLFTLPDSIRSVAEKLIRRHPHVFGDKKIDSPNDVATSWEETKKKEGKKSPIEGIPPTLPALARAQKVIHKLRRAKSPIVESPISSPDDLGQKLWELIKEADSQGIEAESALRRICLAYEEKFKS